MGGTLTSLRADRKPIVLWTPWGSIPKAGLHGHVKGRVKAPVAVKPTQTATAAKNEARRSG